MTDKTAVVEVLKHYFGTFSQNRVSTKTLQSDEQCEALADVILTRTGGSDPTVIYDYYVEHTMATGDTYRSSYMSQVGMPMQPEVFADLVMQQLRLKPGVTSATLYREPTVANPLRTPVRRLL